MPEDLPEVQELVGAPEPEDTGIIRLEFATLLICIYNIVTFESRKVPRAL
jgi:hypothetical protein